MFPIRQIYSNLSNYKYPSVNGGDADTIKTNYHKFVFNMSNLPERYGFLDVSYFDGGGFTPSTTGVIRQHFTGYNTGKNYTRCYYNTTWTPWVDLSGEIALLNQTSTIDLNIVNGGDTNGGCFVLGNIVVVYTKITAVWQTVAIYGLPKPKDSNAKIVAVDLSQPENPPSIMDWEECIISVKTGNSYLVIGAYIKL